MAQESWFWYKDPEPKPEPVNLGESLVMMMGAANKNQEPLTATWVRENFQRYQEIAWNDPSKETVLAYFLLQRFVIDRSKQFAMLQKR